MTWLVAAHPISQSPTREVAEVRVFVVRAETEAGVRAKMLETYPELVVRCVRPASS
jgi:hypothetical protein